jgi:cell wall-associated NlpC family hydrolase
MVHFLISNNEGLKNKLLIFVPLLLCILALSTADAFSQSRSERKEKNIKPSTASRKSGPETELSETAPFSVNHSGDLPDSIVVYAKTLIGTPYVYASADPKVGFDCSGFITHVFNHFNLTVPRSSVDFTNYGLEIPKEETKPGDLILFTGTDSTIRVVGHMGIIVENNNGEIQFIHSSSGHAHGVVITPLNEYYKGRFVKTIRVFKT